MLITIIIIMEVIIIHIHTCGLRRGKCGGHMEGRRGSSQLRAHGLRTVAHNNTNNNNNNSNNDIVY